MNNRKRGTRYFFLQRVSPPTLQFIQELPWNAIPHKISFCFFLGSCWKRRERGRRISFTRARFTRDLMKLSVMGEVFWLFCASFFPLSKVFYFFGKEVFLLFMAMLVWWCMGRSVTGVYILLKIRDLYIADNSVER